MGDAFNLVAMGSALNVAAVVSLGLTLVAWLLSLTRHHQGLNFLVNGNRFGGWARVFSGTTVWIFGGITVKLMLTAPVWPGYAMMVFFALAGGYLFFDGLRVLRNYAR